VQATRIRAGFEVDWLAQGKHWSQTHDRLLRLSDVGPQARRGGDLALEDDAARGTRNAIQRRVQQPYMPVDLPKLESGLVCEEELVSFVRKNPTLGRGCSASLRQLFRRQLTRNRRAMLRLRGDGVDPFSIDQYSADSSNKNDSQ
jgi:hypothetical protein